MNNKCLIKKPVCLIIRDGWGINTNPAYNAVSSASTPNVDGLLNQYPHTILEASGTFVGLPPGYQGSSEVGHLNIGAGRIVEQEIKRINDLLVDGSFFKKPIFQQAIKNCLMNSSTLHLMGLIQDEGVHAHQDHLFAIINYAHSVGIKDVVIHFFTDGRDTSPRSASGFLHVLNEYIQKIGIGTIGTVMGRYYAMDRSKNWRLTTQTYNILTKGEGYRRCNTAQQAIEEAYNKDTTPDGGIMFDEYILPTTIGTFSGIKDGDSVIHFNYRQDRAIQLSQAFIDDNYPGKRWKKVDCFYAGLTKYYDEFPCNILESITQEEKMVNLLGEVISKCGLRQLRISETQKFRHVTSFFNGKRTNPFPLEDQIEIPGMYDPGRFAQYPQMNAYDVLEEVVARIKLNAYAFIVVNFANCDMVGHTGNYESAIEAVEVVDDCVGKVVNVTLEHNVIALVTSDHGNAEEMVDYKTGLPKTAHTKNPVDFIYVADDYKEIRLRERGVLSDIAPTILYLSGIPIPYEMTAQNLISQG